MTSHAVVLAATALLAGCSLFGAEQEQQMLQELPVVADDKPFDPSQAVDDDDDLDQPWSGPERVEDQDAFAAEDRAPAARAKDGAAPRDASARPDGASARRRTPGGPPPDVPAEEHVASPAEVEALRAHRQRQLETAGGADGDVKAEIASNPPPEPLGPARPAAWTVLDYALEGTLLATLALAITLLVGLARRWPKTALTIGLGALATVAFVFVTQGE
jgi:hypothetical protein